MDDDIKNRFDKIQSDLDSIKRDLFPDIKRQIENALNDLKMKFQETKDKLGRIDEKIK